MSNITITESAQTHFANLLGQQPDGTNIRIFVVNPGTQNAECGVSYCPPEAVEGTDTEIPYQGFSAYVDELSLPFLEDAEIDYVSDKMGSQLTLKAPNAKMRKVSDDAPLIERVEYAIQTQVNPQLAGTVAMSTWWKLPIKAWRLSLSAVVVTVVLWWMSRSKKALKKSCCNSLLEN